MSFAWWSRWWLNWGQQTPCLLCINTLFLPLLPILQKQTWVELTHWWYVLKNSLRCLVCHTWRHATKKSSQQLMVQGFVRLAWLMSEARTMILEWCITAWLVWAIKEIWSCIPFQTWRCRSRHQPWGSQMWMPSDLWSSLSVGKASSSAHAAKCSDLLSLQQICKYWFDGSNSYCSLRPILKLVMILFCQKGNSIMHINDNLVA